MLQHNVEMNIYFSVPTRFSLICFLTPKKHQFKIIKEMIVEKHFIKLYMNKYERQRQNIWRKIGFFYKYKYIA